MRTTSQAAPVSLRISITDKCQQRCLYCMPAEGVPRVTHEEILSFEEIVRFVRAMQANLGLTKVHVTGGEPLVRKGVAELVAMLAGERVPDLALTTNAQLLAGMAHDLKHAGLRRVNVSLDSLDADTYTAITRGGDLQSALDGIEAARQAGLTPVKFNVVVLRGYNDGEATDLVRYAFRRGCGIRFIELMPIGCAREVFSDCFVPASEVRARLSETFRLDPTGRQPGRSSRDFIASGDNGLRGVVGFISPETEPFCDGCRRLRLTSTGHLISCLARREGPSVRDLLRDDSPHAVRELVAMATAALAGKQTYPAHVATRGTDNRNVSDADRPMFKVGG